MQRPDFTSPDDVAQALRAYQELRMLALTPDEAERARAALFAAAACPLREKEYLPERSDALLRALAQIRAAETLWSGGA